MDVTSPVKPKHRGVKPNPLLKASWISNVLCCWALRVIWHGYRNRLEKEDVYDILPNLSSKVLFRKLQSIRNCDAVVLQCSCLRHGLDIVLVWLWPISGTELLQKRSWDSIKKHALLVSIWKLQCRSIMKYLIGIAITETCNVIQPILITMMVASLHDGSQASNQTAYLCAAGSVASIFVGGIFAAWTGLGWYTIAMELRSMLTAAIYRKVLCLSNASLSRITSGHIVTLVATDVEKFHKVSDAAGEALFAIVEVPVILGLLSLDYGLSVIGGVILMAVFTLLFIFIAKESGNIRFQVAECTDARVLVMSEILAAMRVIKMYCWEKPFASIIMKHRKAEIRKVLKMILVRSLSSSISSNMSKIGVMTMGLYQVWTGGALEIGTLLRLIAWWEILRRVGCYFVAYTLGNVSEMIASVERIQKFLQSEEKENLLNVKEHEVESDAKPVNMNRGGSSEFAVGLSKFSAAWTETFSIDSISFTVPKGSLVAIIGPVGAGKTSLLMAMLGELPASSGSLYVSGSVGYVPQEPWIFSDSLRANILFDTDLEYNKYTSTIQACCLQPDISSMPHGDMTLVGERGLMLSGGQKARINMARAMYRDADIFLLDDPLSAVDAKVGHQIFDRCILGKWKGKTCILVTHQLHYLDKVDHIYVIKEGKMVADGSYKDLTEKVDLQSVISWNKTTAETIDNHEGTLPEDKEEKILPSSSTNSVEEEDRCKGQVSLATFTKFLQAGHGAIMFPVVLLLYGIYRAVFFGTDAWLNFWVLDYDNLLEDGNTTLPLDVKSSEFIDWAKHRTWVYVTLIFAAVLLLIIGNFLFGLLIALASKKMHNEMFKRILRVQIAFFDSNPVGRILNRFSRDTGFVDDQLSYILIVTVEYAVMFLAICVMMCVSNPWSLIPTVPLFVIIILFRQFSIKAMREVKRIEANDRSPVFSHLSTTLQGLCVIRAFGMENQLTDTFDQYQDIQAASWYLFIAIFRTFGLYCDIILGVYYALVLLVLFLLPTQDRDPGLIGISLVHVVINTLGYLQFVMRLSAELESVMTSVERIQQYSHLDQEAPEHTEVLPPKDWPQKGQIKLDHLSFTYKEGEPHVLKDISINIEGQQKVGIVGRTGAGKSSLFSAMLRLYEPEGHIWIDGIDITKLGLTDLRQAISVIPQDPVLFSGTFRYNLDPFSEYKDEQIWKALEEVQLKNKVLGLSGGLDASMTESGSNLSVGERQLICLSRAILRECKIVIIDEATANVDHRTDDLIQTTIREKFDQSTLLCIAHRLNTIIDSHKVLVLDAGRVVQFGHPYTLLQDDEGAFHQMALYAGPVQFRYLKTAAKEAFLKQKHKDTEDVAHNGEEHIPKINRVDGNGLSDDDILDITRL